MLAAEAEYHRIRRASAFIVRGASHHRKVNQHVCEYVFSDGSVLRVFRGYATVATGQGNYRTVIIGTIAANAFGA